KFLGGHSDLLLGALVARDPELAERLRHRRATDGSVPGALEAFLALRGLRTLAVRLDRAERTAGELARRLAAHPAVARVRYPGLADDPGHELAARQMSGPGALLAFETVGDAATAERVCEAVELVTHATSLGGVESLIERRARYPGDAAAGTPPPSFASASGSRPPATSGATSTAPCAWRSSRPSAPEPGSGAGPRIARLRDCGRHDDHNPARVGLGRHCGGAGRAPPAGPAAHRGGWRGGPALRPGPPRHVAGVVVADGRQEARGPEPLAD